MTRTILILGQADDGREVSSDEFAEADFTEPWRFEREDGRLTVLAPGGEGHLDATEPWRDELVFYKRLHPNVIQKLVSEAWIRVNEGTDRVGDIGVYLVPDGPVPMIPDRVPDLIFEVVSPGQVSRRRDHMTKHAEYHRFGVKEYVVIDRFRKIVTVLIHEPAGYVERQLQRNDVYESSLLPEFSLRLSDIFV